MGQSTIFSKKKSEVNRVLRVFRILGGIEEAWSVRRYPLPSASQATGHWPPATILSPPSSTWGSTPPVADWLRFRPADSVADDSTSSGKDPCVDSELASFCAFSEAGVSSCVGSLRSGSPSSMSPDAPRHSPLPPDPLATVGVRRGARRVERGALTPSLWLRFRPGGSGTDNSTPSGNEPCVDSGLASFCTFSRIFTPEGRLCRSQAPWYGRSVASIPSWDKIPILSFVESSMT